MRMQFLLFFVVLAAVAVAADDQPQLPDAPGKATVLKVCNECHGAEIVLGHPHSEDGWNAIIVDMVQRGAQGTDDEYDEIVKYLTRNIKEGPAVSAKVNVNKAPAKAIETGLGLTAKEAQAIVDARDKAPFKTIDDVKKVSGVDPAKIEAKKAKLSFQ